VLESVLVCAAALVRDALLGEPVRWHPLVWFGRQVDRVERALNRPEGSSVSSGALAAGTLLVPLVLVSLLLMLLPEALKLAVEVIVLWLALSLRGLREHAMAVAAPLARGHLALARTQVGRIVSRETSTLDDTGVATATTESVLENGADAVFASLFWFLLAGLPGVVLHRAVNTLDAMWGYRNQRFNRFGRVAARLDDVMNYLPARLTALAYALAGSTSLALRCWRTQARYWESPNAGPVMAAGAGALAVRLGGPAPYREGMRERPLLGAGPPPTALTIERALTLVTRSVWLWLTVAALGAWMAGVFTRV